MRWLARQGAAEYLMVLTAQRSLLASHMELADNTSRISIAMVTPSAADGRRYKTAPPLRLTTVDRMAIYHRFLKLFPSTHFHNLWDAKYQKGHFPPGKWPFFFGWPDWKRQLCQSFSIVWSQPPTRLSGVRVHRIKQLSFFCRNLCRL